MVILYHGYTLYIFVFNILDEKWQKLTINFSLCKTAPALIKKAFCLQMVSLISPRSFPKVIVTDFTLLKVSKTCGFIEWYSGVTHPIQTLFASCPGKTFLRIQLWPRSSFGMGFFWDSESHFANPRINVIFFPKNTVI